MKKAVREKAILVFYQRKEGEKMEGIKIASGVLEKSLHCLGGIPEGGKQGKTGDGGEQSRGKGISSGLLNDGFSLYHKNGEEKVIQG